MENFNKIFSDLYDLNDIYEIKLCEKFYYLLFDFCKKNCKNKEEINEVLLWAIDVDLVEHYSSYFEYKNKIYHINLNWIFELKKWNKNWKDAIDYINSFAGKNLKY